MKHKRRRLFEGMYILSATLSEEARKNAFTKITSSITEKGGEIHQIHEIGRQRLAYPIRQKKEGFYYLIYFTITSDCIAPMWEEYHLHEDLLRFITLQASKVKETLEFKPRLLKE